MWNPYQPLPQSKQRVLAISSVVTVLIGWAIGAWIVSSPSQLPTPWACVEGFMQLAWNPERKESLLLIGTIYSVTRVFLASMLMVAIGVPVGILLGASPRLNAFFSPLIDPFRSAPVVALLPIFVMWFGIGEAMKVVFLFFGAVVYLIPMVRDAVVAVNSNYYISARDIGFTPFESIRYAVVPMAMPRIADAIIAAVSIEWTYITVAEYVNAGQGLGEIIQNARRFSAMYQVFPAIGVIIVLALITYVGMSWLKHQLYPWESK